MKLSVRSIYAMFAALAVMMLVACGGGSSSGGASSGGSSNGGGSGASSSSVSLNLSGLGDSSSSAAASGVQAASIVSYLTTIHITVTGADMTTVVADVDITNPSGAVVTINVPAGTGRTFTVEALDASYRPIFKGQRTVDIVTASLDLDITMADQIKQAMLDYGHVTSLKSPNLVASDIDSFFSADYGVYDGRTRQEIIDGEVWRYNNDSGKTWASVDGMEPKTATASGYAITPTIIQKDGTALYLPLYYTYENGRWRTMGNGAKTHVAIMAYNRMDIATSGQITFAGGIRVELADPAGKGFQIAEISGPGIENTSVGALIDSFGRVALESSGYDYHLIPDETLATIPNNATYTVKVYDSEHTIIEERTIKVPTRAYLSTQLASSFFSSLTDPATADHFLYFTNGDPLTFQYALPTSYSATSATMIFDYWDSSLNEKYFSIARPLSATSVTFNTEELPGYQYAGFFRALTTDPKGRCMDMSFQYRFGD